MKIPIFVLPDAKIMVKRPKNKKVIFQIFVSVFTPSPYKFFPTNTL
jgi:hypothetical protein